MATYKDIQAKIKECHPNSKTVRTCWIAHVKEMNGLKPRVAPNRINPMERSDPCPNHMRSLIEDSMRLLGMIN
jgi:hypothetical protein